MKEKIRQTALDLGFDACRFTTAAPPPEAGYFRRWLASGYHGGMQWLARQAEKRCDPQRLLPEAKSLILLAVSYHTHDRPETERTTFRGLVARYARFHDYHEVLLPSLEEMRAAIEKIGGAGTRSLAMVDSGPLMERALAQRAGLGFIGKHTNLIHRQLGNWHFLAGIVTTLGIEPDPPQRNHCGSCARCQTVCPTNAFVEPFCLDARRCVSYLTIENKGSIPEPLRPSIGNRIFGCDDCLEACPWNRFAHEGRLLRPHALPHLGMLDLGELLALDEAAFQQRFSNTPLARAKRRGLRRNVCVALGNIGDASCLPLLAPAVREPDPLIAEHAAWAMEQIRAR